jgi:hypothetical protein
MIHSKVTISCFSSVPTIASNIPISARCIPRRAVSGWLRPFSPRMKKIEANR